MTKDISGDEFIIRLSDNGHKFFGANYINKSYLFPWSKSVDMVVNFPWV